jgi:uncharacterized protein with von Willebrand factor type A (vWA) domain
LSDLLVPFLYELRKRDLRVGTTEMVQLARGVALGLHGSSLDGFYYLARAVLVHREGELDRFDQAFLHHFRGVDARAAELFDELAQYGAAMGENGALDAATRSEGTDGDTEPEWLREMLGRRLEDAEDPGEVEPGTLPGIGNRAARNPGRGRIGSGASQAASPRGSGAVGMADARRYRRYRSDVVLDVRQIEVALRRLRAFSRDGRQEELDVDATVDATARAFGDLEIVLRPPRKSHVRVLLLMDVGGSMEPFAQLCSQLFSAAKRASNLRELRSYYFHNIVYGRVFSTDGSMTPVEIPDLFELVNQRWKLVVVGDASMAPGEMLSVGPWGSTWRRPDNGGPMRGLDWLVTLAERFDRSVWLNPDPPSYWVGGTVEIIGQVFQMHTLSLDGLTEAVTYLSKETQGKRPKIIGNPRNAL